MQLNEAENMLTEASRLSRFRGKLLERIEGIVRESVRPMEKIDGIKILHIDGANGGGGSGNRNVTDEVIDSALRYRVQAPMIDSLMKEIGIEGGSLGRMTDVLRDAKDIESLSRQTRQGRSTGILPERQRPATTIAERPREMAKVYASSRDSGVGERGLGASCATSTDCRNGRHSSRRAGSSTCGRPTRSAASGTFASRMADRIRERLLALSDYDMSCTYSILESPMGVENYRRDAAADSGDRRTITAFAEWTAEFDAAPEREAALVDDIGSNVFAAGLEALKTRFAR